MTRCRCSLWPLPRRRAGSRFPTRIITTQSALAATSYWLGSRHFWTTRPVAGAIRDRSPRFDAVAVVGVARSAATASVIRFLDGVDYAANQVGKVGLAEV